VPLGPENAQWTALQRALGALCNEAGASHVAIFDESCLMWCAYFAGSESSEATAERLERDGMTLFTRHIAPQKERMRRGARVHVCRCDPAESELYVLESFAGIYVLALWFSDTFPELSALAKVRRALPDIEALTLALPPPDGPDATSGTGAQRA